jgi:hypothetical protein
MSTDTMSMMQKEDVYETDDAPVNVETRKPMMDGNDVVELLHVSMGQALSRFRVAAHSPG